MKKAIIFDMDGLMIDSERVTYEEYCRKLEQLEYNFDENMYRRCLGKNKQSVYGLYADIGICGKLDDRQMIPCIGIQKQAVSTCADSNKDFSAYAVETDCKI